MMRLAPCTLALVAGCAMPVATYRVEISDACVTYKDLAVPGAEVGTSTFDRTFTYDQLDQVQAVASAVTDFAFLRIDVRATSGITSFAFVQAAHVSVSGTQLPTLEVYSCDGDCVDRGDALSVPSRVAASALPYVESGAVVVDLGIDGAIPHDAWTMDVDFCFRGELDSQTTL